MYWKGARDMALFTLYTSTLLANWSECLAAEPVPVNYLGVLSDILHATLYV